MVFSVCYLNNMILDDLGKDSKEIGVRLIYFCFLIYLYLSEIVD